MLRYDFSRHNIFNASRSHWYKSLQFNPPPRSQFSLGFYLSIQVRGSFGGFRGFCALWIELLTWTFSPRLNPLEHQVIGNRRLNWAGSGYCQEPLPPNRTDLMDLTIIIGIPNGRIIHSVEPFLIRLVLKFKIHFRNISNHFRKPFNFERSFKILFIIDNHKTPLSLRLSYS